MIQYHLDLTSPGFQLNLGKALFEVATAKREHLTTDPITLAWSLQPAERGVFLEKEPLRGQEMGTPPGR